MQARKKQRILERKNLLEHQQKKQKMLFFLNTALKKIQTIHAVKNYGIFLNKIFGDFLKILKLKKVTWKENANTATLVLKDGINEKIDIIGSGSFGSCGVLTKDSQIFAGCAVKKTSLFNALCTKEEAFKNWVIENIILFFVSKQYEFATHNVEKNFPFAALQHPFSNLLWLGYNSKTSSCLSGLFLYKTLHDTNGALENPGVILLQVAAVLDYVNGLENVEFMHRDLHFNNLMIFESWNAEKDVSFALDKDNFLVQDSRSPLATQTLTMKKNNGANVFYKIIDFGFAFLNINDDDGNSSGGTVPKQNVPLCTNNNIYNKHDFNDQHDLRTLIVSFYDAYCVDFCVKTKKYVLDFDPKFKIIVDFVEIASRHSERFKMVTDVQCLTEIQSYVLTLKRNKEFQKTHALIDFKQHVKRIANLLGPASSLQHTEIRLKSLYDNMLPQMVYWGAFRYKITHFFYNFMVSHTLTPLFVPKNVFNFVIHNDQNLKNYSV